jgi:hypothetical protein
MQVCQAGAGKSEESGIGKGTGFGRVLAAGFEFIIDKDE